LKTVLRQFPPPQPKKPAVDLLVAVGDQQQYLLQNGLSPPPGSEGALDALQVDSLQYTALYVTTHKTTDSLSDCRSGRRTEGFVREFHPIRGDTL